jgi:ribosome modulation factor
MDRIERARFQGVMAGRPSAGAGENPYPFDSAEHQAWEDGWHKVTERHAVMIWHSRYYAAHDRNPTVGEAAAAFFLTSEQVAEHADDQFFFRTHTDRVLAAQELEQDGE